MCKQLKDVKLGNSVKSVSDTVFFGTPQPAIQWPANLGNPGRYVTDLASVTRVMLPEDLTIIGEGWFAETGVKEVHIPAGVVEICDWAFNGCKHLKSVELAQNSKLQWIRAGAFQDT